MAAKTEGGCRSISLKDVAPDADADLRKPARARKLEEELLRLDVEALWEAMAPAE